MNTAGELKFCTRWGWGGYEPVPGRVEDALTMPEVCFKGPARRKQQVTLHRGPGLCRLDRHVFPDCIESTLVTWKERSFSNAEKLV